MVEISLNASKREITTKGTVNQMRENGMVPGVYYTKGNESIPFSVQELAINPLVFTSETHVIMLQIEGEEPLRCIIKDVQFDPVSDRAIHVDLMGITLGQILHLKVPVVLVGTPEGVKEGGLIQHYIHKLEVECLPRNIPEHLKIDISHLLVGDTIHVRDLEFENIKLLSVEDAAVVGVAVAKVVVEEGIAVEEVEEAESAEPEVISKGKAEEESEK